jgi:penicillin G amidase
MADDLTGYTEDIPLTLLRDQLPKDEFEYLFPQRLHGSKPVIPEGTMFNPPSLATPQPPGDTVWSHFQAAAGTAINSLPPTDNEQGIGSNSWAISGAHTSNGASILCNDPHLGLNLPSLWFEIQLQSPDMNCYGVSLPGAPGVVIGFNDSMAWGFTNNYRDVKDFYEIEAIDKDFYRFDGNPQAFQKRAEVIKVKGKEDVVDTILYTSHGPIMYDETFPDPAKTGRKLALCWMAHRGTNELLSLYLLNRAKTYIDFSEAILHFECPAQNMVYADRAGNIAMWGQGQFINKWRDQGRYVMKGNTSATLWGENIPMTENPHVQNPEQGFVVSANQITTDSTYPYWYNGYFYDFRAWRINEILSRQGEYSTSAMMGMQNDVYSILAMKMAPVLDKAAKSNKLGEWDYSLAADSKQAAKFQVIWARLYENLWKRFLSAGLYPSVERTMQIILADTSISSARDSTAAGTIRVAIENAYQGGQDSLNTLEKNGALEWYKAKNTTLTHLAKISAFSYKGLKVGGWGNTINATKTTHGPSWRMIVEMGKESLRAYGVYPGGQSGNPGSKYYGTFVNNWAEGKYYNIAFLPNMEKHDSKAMKYSWNIKPGKK